MLKVDLRDVDTRSTLQAFIPYYSLALMSPEGLVDMLASFKV